MVRMRKGVLLLLFAVTVWSAAPAAMQAAAIELTAPVKADFDKTVKGADAGSAAKLKQLYPALQASLNEDLQLKAQIKAQHYANEQALLALRKEIRLVDGAKLDKLKGEVAQMKAKYKPLFDEYTALNKQIAIVRKLKSKLLNDALRFQADAMKVATQLARDKIRAKETELKNAKAAAAAKIKAARNTLGETDTLKVKIKSLNSAAALPRKSQSAVWTDFKYAIKKSETRSALNALDTLASLAKQVADKQREVLAAEKKIAAVIAKTKTQIAAAGK
ncbi:hypothetical protein [Cohnella panacarvi]|uniref:hypothetical protein n=1 Tax=Cohnella panacarvi TaxID=400776 RepID=UPI00047E46E0|nr:hypothetical protein [Cohnella panacarvi]